MRPPATGRSLGPVLAAACLVLVTSACSPPWSGPDAGDAVKHLAKALSAGDLGGVDFVGDDARARSDFEAATGDVGKTLTDDVTISAGSVSTDGDAATGVLHWRWKVGPGTWDYTTKVALALGEGDAGQSWLVSWDPAILEPSLAPGERLAESSVEAERGSILGAGDKPIVEPRPVLRVGIDKAALGASPPAESARSLARLVDIAVGPFVKQVTAAGPKAFVQGIVYRREDLPPPLLARLRAVPGARAISDQLPLAPTKDFASALLGTVGPATAELVKDGQGRIRPGDDVGLSGLQKRYDEQLAGTRGATVAAVDAQGERRTLFTADPEAGKPLHTTLDIAAQLVAQKALSGVASASALVAVRPSTGELLAVASGPGSKGYSTATIGRYAPGSTFKVVSALALLRAGVTPRTQVSCPATTVVDGKRFKNYDDYPSSGLGRIRFEDALANSCNTAFISQRGELDPPALAEAAAALGLGTDHDTGFPSYFGSVGEPSSETQAAASMIGQGTVLASPMAMAAVVASVVKGSAVLPRLLPDHAAEQQQPAEPLSSTEAQQLRAMMQGVVQRGSGRVLADLPGGPVIAKTGTAEFGEKPPLPTHAWMVAGRGDLAVAVFVERGDSGSGTAGPILHRFLEAVQVP